jgi:HEPN domain-containing protein
LSRRNAGDVAKALLEKARGDEIGLRVLADRTDVPDHVVGFLAQQAIEKALKSVLTARGVPFERSHDIEYLCDLAKARGFRLHLTCMLPSRLRLGRSSSATPTPSTRAR